MHVLWFAGLRGAVAFMCALSFPQNSTAKNRGVVITTTIMVAFGSMIFFGWPTAAFLRCLKIEGDPDFEDDADADDTLFHVTPTVGNITALQSRKSAKDSGKCACIRWLKPSLRRMDERIKTLVMAKQAREEREAAHQEAGQLRRVISQQFALKRAGSCPADQGLGVSLQEVSPAIPTLRVRSVGEVPIVRKPSLHTICNP